MNEFLARCEAKGITLTLKNGQNISYRTSKGPIEKDMLKYLKKHKSEIVLYLHNNGQADKDTDGAELIHDESKRYQQFPLTDIQSAYYSGRQSGYELGGTGCYTYIEIKSDLIEVIRFQDAWHKTIMKHDMLRAIITKDGKQVVKKEVEMPALEVREVNVSQGLENSFEVKKIRDQMYTYDFAVASWPMHKFIISQGKTYSIIHFCVDMLIADYISINIILNDIFDYYNNGKFSSEANSQITFRDIVLSRKKNNKNQAAKEYWKDKIANNEFKCPELPVIRSKNTPDGKADVVFGRRKMMLGRDSYAALKEAAAQNGVTVSNAVLAAYASILGRWSESKQMCINVTLMQRSNEEMSIVGDFTSVDMLTVSVEEEPFIDLVRRIQTTLLKDIAHMEFSGVEVLREVNRYVDENKIFPVVFTSTVGEEKSKNYASDLEIIEGISRTPQVWIDCQVIERNGELEIHWDVRDGIFKENVISDMFTTFENTIKKIVTDSDWTDKEALTFAPDYFKDRDSYNHAEKAFEKRMLYDGVLKNIAERPDEMAIIFDEQKYTYREFGKYIQSVMQLLQSKNVQKGDNVAIIQPRGIWQVASVMGTLLSGCAFVPIDVNQPSARQQKIITSSNSRFILLADDTNSQIEDAFQEKVIHLTLQNEISRDIASEPTATPDDLAYIIFTSGTTGVPKGVMITHEAAENTIIDINEKFNVSNEDVFLGLTKLSFDLSIYDIFGCFDAGGTLVIPKESSVINPVHWMELVEENGVTIWNSVPALLKMLLQELNEGNRERVQSLRLFLLSGDVIDNKLPGKVRELLKDYQMISLGGATEGSVWSLYWNITDFNENTLVPYGIPLSNQKMFVLNSDFRQCPNEVKGEIYIGGDGLASGYYGDKELTDEKFLYNDQLKERLFRTGDIGYYTEDGILMICGRRDNQIKINGNRVEIGEIESVIKETKEAADCTVIYHKRPNKSNKLFVFLEPYKSMEENLGQANEVEIGRLKEACNQRFEDISREDFMRWKKQSDKAALADMLALFVNLGLFDDAGKKHSRKEIHNTTNEQAEFNRIVDRMLRALVEAEILNCTANMYGLTEKASEYKDRDTIWDDFMAIGNEINYGEALMQYQRESGRKILEQIRGDITGLSLFFPEGNTDVAVAAYRENMINQRLNYVAADLINNCCKTGASILEIGAGVGGTTTTVLENLNCSNVSYCFTDVSQFFINKAKTIYADYGFLDYNLLDINKDYDVQGFKDNEYDIILCANVLHNSQNIEVNLSKIKKMLKPDGYLIIMEATKESYLLTTSLELKGGLDGFTDHRSSGIDVFTSGEKWIELIEKAGYNCYFILPENDDLLSECGQSVLFCQNKAAAFSKKMNVEAIEKYMAARLPVYMIPDQIEIIDKIPLTGNGKIDRKALNGICEERLASGKKGVVKEQFSGVEQQISDIWKSVLNVTEISKKDNFYYVGGDSLLITQVVSKMRESIEGLENTSWDELMQDALNNPTIEGIADVIQTKTAEKTPARNTSAQIITRQTDSSMVVYRDNPEKRKLVQAYLHAGTGRLVDYEFLIPELLEQTSDDISVVGFMYGNNEEYLSVPAEEVIKKRAEKYAQLLLDMKAESYEVLGYCVGGFLALETARILLENNANVKNVIMISSELATHMVHNQMITELAYGTAIGLDMRKAGYDIDIVKMKKCMEDILKGEHRNIKNSELITLSGEYEEYGKLFTALLDDTHEERMKNIFEKAGGEKFNGNESTFSMFKILYNIFEHTFKAMMNYKFDEFYFGNVLYLEAPTVNSFYPETKKPTSFDEVCLGELTIKPIDGNHATCLNKDNYHKVLDVILETLDEGKY